MTIYLMDIVKIKTKKKIQENFNTKKGSHQH